MPLTKIIQSAFVFLLPFLVHAQTYHFTNYGVKDGLAQSNVSGIIQDSAGFYWLATDGGVSRFDGKNFINYTTEDGLADNNVSAIFLDRSHTIWLGHENGMLTRFDGKTFSQINSKLLPKDKKIYGFFQDKRGSLWISTASAGAIQIMDPTRVKEKMHIKVYSGREGLSQYVFSTSEDKEGNLWFMTDIGVKIMNKTTHNFDFFRPNNMPLGQISSLYSDKDHNFIMGTMNGSVIKYDFNSKIIETLISSEESSKAVPGAGPNYIYTVTQDSKGNIWATGSNHGAYKYNPATKKVNAYNTSNGLSSNKIRNIFEDKEGNMLFGTNGEGLDVYSGERFVSFSKRNGLKDNQVWAICKDRKDKFWFGTNEGLTIYDPTTTNLENTYKNIGNEEGLNNTNIRSIITDRAGNLWIGTWGGKVLKYDIESSKFMQIGALNEIVNPLVSSLMLDKKNNLWIGTYEGIVIYDLDNGSIKTLRTIDGLSDNDISCIVEDSKGRVWIGTKQKGVTLYDGQTFKKFNRENGLINTSISSIAEDKLHHIWIGTEGGGAFVYDGKTFRNFKTKDGLVSDFITLIASDKKNNIWLGTNKGLNRYDVDKTLFYSISNGDGFTGQETKPNAVYTDNKNNVWFGTVNGAFKYSPEFDLPVKSEPLTKILKFQVNLKERSIHEEIDLSYLDNNLIFDYIGISLSNAEGVYYKIKLEGYEDEWKTVKHTTEIYSNLPHNEYVFKLIACNSSGVCSQEVSLKITINPPYWKTWWFYLIVMSVVVGGLFAYIKIRERKLLQEKKILEDKVNERTAEVVEKNKELDEINKDITASIRYAKRIQDAILPPDDFVRQHLPNTFVLFKPKDIVSGDFYWMEENKDSVIFAAVDCTGHGVPGAFMSIVGHNLLDRVVGEQKVFQPAKILDELNKSISDTLRQTDLEDNTVKDGMDIAICSFNKKKGVLEYAGAYNPLWIIRNNELIEVKANKFPIGNSKSGENNKFTNHEIPLEKGDTVYIFSDGYSDQFGGPGGKKFKSSALKQLLIANQHLSMQEQRELLNSTIEKWRGQHEQVDDILVIGTRYN